LGDASALYIGSEGFRCSEHISALKNPGSKRISAFYGVFCRFSGIRPGGLMGRNLYTVVFVL
jgi:hypothetical protein